MRFFRSIWLSASVLFLLVHQLVPHHHEHHTNATHFCAQEQSETWSKLVGGLSLDLGQHHLEWFHSPEGVQILGFKSVWKSDSDHQKVDKGLLLFGIELSPPLRLIHPLSVLFRRPDSNAPPRVASVDAWNGRAPPRA
ncbi:MAG: hypothetical protein ACO3GN_00100 [Bacteroidia bacterium]